MTDDLRRALSIEAALRQREITTRRAAVEDGQKQIEILQENLETMESLYDSLRDSVVTDESRLADAHTAIRTGNQERSMQEKIRNDPETPPQKYREDLYIIHRAMTQAETAVTDIEPRLRRERPELARLEQHIERARQLAESFLAQTAEDQEWLDFAEPLVSEMRELTVIPEAEPGSESDPESGSDPE